MIQLHPQRPTAKGQYSWEPSAWLHSTQQPPPRAPQGSEVCVHPVEHSARETDLFIPMKVEQGEIYKPLGAQGV